MGAQGLVTIRLPHVLHQVGFPAFDGYGRLATGFIGPGIVVAPVTEEGLLQLSHMLDHLLFSDLLHAGIDRRVDAETVAVDIVRGTVCFSIFWQLQQVFDFLCQNHPEIRCQTIDMRLPGEIDPQRRLSQLVVFRLIQVPYFFHLTQDHFPAVQDGFRASQRIVEGGVLEHTDQHGTFLQFQIAGAFSEVDFSSRSDSLRTIDEVVTIKVQGNDLVLGILSFEAYGNDPLLQFLGDGLQDVAGTHTP